MRKILLLLVAVPFLAFGQNGISQVFNELRGNLSPKKVSPFKINRIVLLP